MEYLQRFAAYLLKLTKGWLPQAIEERLEFFSNPEYFLLHHLSEKAITSEEGYASFAIGPTWWPLQSFFMLTKKEQIKALTDYGTSDKTNNDLEARKLYSKLAELLGNEPIVMHGGEVAKEERQELRPFIFKKESIQQVGDQTINSINRMLAHWDNALPINRQVAYAVLQAVGQSFYGIDTLPMDIIDVLAKAEQAMTFHESSSPFFQEAKEQLLSMSDVIAKNNPNLCTKDNYMSYMYKKMGLNDPVDMNPAASLLVTNNIAFLVVGAVLQIAQSKKVYDRLMVDLASMDVRDLNEKRLSDYPYLNAIYNETLRYYSPTAMIARYAGVQAEMGEVNIPSGSFLFVPIARIHHSSYNYSDPDIFNPDRYSESGESKDIIVNSEKLCPFSLGYRSCPASHLYTQKVFMAAISTIFSQVQFKLDHEIETLDFYGKLIRFSENYYAKEMTPSFDMKQQVTRISSHDDVQLAVDSRVKNCSFSL